MIAYVLTYHPHLFTYELACLRAQHGVSRLRRAAVAERGFFVKVALSSDRGGLWTMRGEGWWLPRPTEPPSSPPTKRRPATPTMYSCRTDRPVSLSPPATPSPPPALNAAQLSSAPHSEALPTNPKHPRQKPPRPPRPSVTQSLKPTSCYCSVHHVSHTPRTKKTKHEEE